MKINMELIEPFVSSTISTLKTMAQTEPICGEPYLKKGTETWGVVSGLIGMAGDDVSGNMILSFDQASILGIVSKMFMETIAELNNEVGDAVGELTNVICGGTKARLSELGYSVQMATPIVMIGKNVSISQQGDSPAWVIPFETANGKFVLESCLAKRRR